MVDQLLSLVTLVVVGFTACAEFGSYAFVHPVIRRLPVEHHIEVEKGLVKTFGRFMPVAMTLSLLLLSVWSALVTTDLPAVEIAATALWGIGLVTTIAVNVGINARTARWETEGSDPATWREMRRRWDLFQGVRSFLFVIAFVLACLAVTTTG